MNRPNFGKPPPGYVAGLGRGATGFTTRADIGPARQPSVGGDAILSGIGRGSGLPVSNDPLLAHETGQTFNAWSGYEEALFVNAGGDAEDLEADKMFDDVEDYLDGRRRDKRTKQMKKELDKIQEEAPKFQEEFADVKEKLKDVTREEWE